MATHKERHKAGRSRTGMSASFDRPAHHRMIHVNLILRPLRVTCRVGVRVHQGGVEHIPTPGSAGGYHCLSLIYVCPPLYLPVSDSLSVCLSLPLCLYPFLALCLSLSPHLSLSCYLRVSINDSEIDHSCSLPRKSLRQTPGGALHHQPPTHTLRRW